jgi:hypothetical protein
MNLFAILGQSVPRVRRFALTAAIQSDLAQKLTQQAAAFEASIAEDVAFDGKYKPEDDEVLFIENVAGVDDLLDAVLDPLSCVEIDATIEEFENIRGLFSGWSTADGEVTILLQNFDRRRVISTDGFSLYHAANVFRKIEGIGLSLDTKLAASLVGGTLRFRSFHNVRQILDLADYFVEATDIDIAEFAALDRIKVTDMEALLGMADSWTRRKITLVQQSQILTSVPMQEIRSVAQEFGITITCSLKAGAEAIDLPSSKKELKRLLRFLDEDYYQSALSKTRFLTNSKRLAS